MLPDSLKLPLRFDARRLQDDLARIVTADYLPHFNKAYYRGDWSVVPLRSIGGRADQIYPWLADLLLTTAGREPATAA